MKNNLSKYFTKDPRWDSFLGLGDFESFRENGIPKIYLKESVPEDVKQSFKIIEKLLLHSFFEYEFYDIAAKEAVLTLEMALKIRYKELTNERWEKKTKKGEQKRDLKNLFDWFYKRNYFEITNEYYLNHVRSIRNHFAHPIQYGFGGVAARQWIEHPLDLINDLYEDVDLRLKRFKRRQEVFEKLRVLFVEGAVVKFENKSLVIYDMALPFVDNKHEPEYCHLLFVPIFEISDIYNKPYDPNHSNFIEVLATKIDFLENGIVVIHQLDTKDIVKVSPMDSQHQNLLDKWKLKYETDSNVQFHTKALQSDIRNESEFLRRAFHRK